jgi:hypothetical protein
MTLLAMVCGPFDAWLDRGDVSAFHNRPEADAENGYSDPRSFRAASQNASNAFCRFPVFVEPIQFDFAIEGQ